MIYNRLAVIRTDAHLSRRALADKVGVNYQTIGFIERGDYQPSLELAFQLAQALHTNITTIFSDKPIKSLFSDIEDL